MKRAILVLAVVMSFTGVANADLFSMDKIYVLNNTNVGRLDSFIAATKLKDSGDATELQWVKDVLKKTDVTLDAKYDTNNDNKQVEKQPSYRWEQIDPSGVWALHFLTKAPDYFVIKTATSSGFDHFLFQNDANLDWAVIRLTLSPEITIKNIGKLSHIDEFNVTSAAVPEPATILLVGCGLVGMVVVARKAKRS